MDFFRAVSSIRVKLIEAAGKEGGPFRPPPPSMREDTHKKVYFLFVGPPKV